MKLLHILTETCSFLKLSTAHARLMYRETVTVEDAVTAVSVMECSMQVRRKQIDPFYCISDDPYPYQYFLLNGCSVFSLYTLLSNTRLCEKKTHWVNLGTLLCMSLLYCSSTGNLSILSYFIMKVVDINVCIFIYVLEFVSVFG